MRIVRLIFFLALTSLARAQDSPTPSPTPSPSPPRAISLRFALPPMQGSISLGIFDASGKLVRVLHREDAISDFTAGHDALETTWDGRDDAGNPLPPGKYRARGYLVGDLKIEGIGYFFNDWVTEENSPRVVRLSQPSLSDGQLRINAELTGDRKISLVCDPVTGQIINQIPVAETSAPCTSVVGKDGTSWSIDNGAVRQFSAEHALLRQLEYAKDDPQPDCIAASPTENRIVLLEHNENLQRLRALSLLRTTGDANGKSISDWKTDFEKQIVAHKNFSIVRGKPVANSPNESPAPEKIGQTLVENPLQPGRAAKVELAAGVDSDGSYLKTADGLPLRTISETQNLSRALLTRHDEKAIDVFQDDGAVVEQFRVSNLDQMMAFDCGEIELK